MFGAIVSIVSIIISETLFVLCQIVGYLSVLRSNTCEHEDFWEGRLLDCEIVGVGANW